MTDIYIFNKADGGDITETLSMRDGLESAVYLSLFGGNIDDDGSEKSTRNWWGNLGENDEAKVYRSTTAHVLATLPPTPTNLRRIEDAAKNDLAWLLEQGITENLDIRAGIPARNQVHLTVKIDGLDPLEFSSNQSDMLESILSDELEVVSGEDDGTSATGELLPLAAFLDGDSITGRTLPNLNVIMIDEENPTAQMRVDGLKVKGKAAPFAVITLEI